MEPKDTPKEGPASEKEEDGFRFVQLYLPKRFLCDPKALEIFAIKHGLSAKLYEAICDGCKEHFVIKACTAIKQLKNFQRFTPPERCFECFSQYPGKSSPTPPGNARIVRRIDRAKSQGEAAAPTKEPSAVLHEVPAKLSYKQLEEFRRKWTGKPVLVHFRPGPRSFSNSTTTADELESPQPGTVLAFTADTIIVTPPEYGTRDSVSYDLDDVASIEFKPFAEYMEELVWKEPAKQDAPQGTVNEEAPAANHRG